MKLKINYDSTEDMLFMGNIKKYNCEESMPISENFTVDFDKDYNVNSLEISFAYEFFKKYDPENFKRNILKEINEGTLKIKEHRDMIILELVFIHEEKEIVEKLLFLKENFEWELNC